MITVEEARSRVKQAENAVIFNEDEICVYTDFPRVKEIMHAITQELNKRPDIKILEFKNCYIYEEGIEIISQAKFITHLAINNLDGKSQHALAPQVNNESMAILAKNPNLQYLDVRGNQHVTAEGVEKIAASNCREVLISDFYKYGDIPMEITSFKKPEEPINAIQLLNDNRKDGPKNRNDFVDKVFHLANFFRKNILTKDIFYYIMQFVNSDYKGLHRTPAELDQAVIKIGAFLYSNNEKKPIKFTEKFHEEHQVTEYSVSYKELVKKEEEENKTITSYSSFTSKTTTKKSNCILM